MKFITDFHIHSKYSRASSKNLVPEQLEYWSKLKGINVLGTGDCIHPGWLKELEEKLEENDNGLLILKKEFQLDNSKKFPNRTSSFILTTEISSIYKKNDKVRKIHSLCVFPDFKSTKKFQSKLDEIGNIHSDGRPILGLDAKTLLEIVLEIHPKAFIIPAHIWTPWFSVLGSKSGFDSLEECYEELTSEIFAVETGLSSDPPMNRICSFLDKFRLVSNSDAHSPEKFGREANIFDTELSYNAIYDSLKNNKNFIGTVEFFPQEGKYHYDGHRKCNVCWDPLETIKHDGICSKCGKQVTKGVLYRVAELADRNTPDYTLNNQVFYSITPLPEIIAQMQGRKSSSSKAVVEQYHRLQNELGSDFDILLFKNLSEIKHHAGDLLAEGISRLRKNQVFINEGYDGEFGKIRVFYSNEITNFSSKPLFQVSKSPEPNLKSTKAQTIEFDVLKFQEEHSKKGYATKNTDIPSKKTDKLQDFITPQIEAIKFKEGVCMVLAGPGTGKTHVLTERISSLIRDHEIIPENILAVTFSNKAANEIKGRAIKKSNPAENSQICTFHSLGLSIIKDNLEQFGLTKGFTIIDSAEKQKILKTIISKKSTLQKALYQIERYKQGQKIEEPIKNFQNILQEYSNTLKQNNSLDLDDLIKLPLDLLSNNSKLLSKYQKKYRWILIDEFQDINQSQYDFIGLLLKHSNPNLFVIGDPDQAIYGFRGSNTQFIEKLKKDYQPVKIIELQKSFRCPTNILKIAGQVLSKSKFLDGQNTSIKTEIKQCSSDKSEADWIAGKIEDMIGGVRTFSMDSGMSDGNNTENINSFNDFAVLCRTKDMFPSIIKAFKDHGIPFQLIDNQPFYKKEPLNKIIRQFKNAYSNPSENEKDTLAFEINKMISMEQPIIRILNRLMIEYEIPVETQNKMTEFAKGFDKDYARFINTTAINSAIDLYEPSQEAVSLMTMHASKGLEFNAVFVPGCEENIIPYQIFKKKNPTEILEEERLFYVALTRTKHYLFLSHALKRVLRFKMFKQSKSNILNRFEKKLIENSARDPKKTTKKPLNQLSLFSDNQLNT